MFDHQDSDRNRSLNSELEDALSSDPTRRSTSGNTMADSISQSIANSIAGNHPDVERPIFGRGNVLSKTTQGIWDDVFAPEKEDADGS